MSSTFSITSLITLRGGAKTEGKGPPKIVKNSGPSFCPPEKCQSWTIELRPTFLIIDKNLYIKSCPSTKVLPLPPITIHKLKSTWNH